MPTEDILALLVAERDKLTRALEALGGNATKRRGRPPGSRNMSTFSTGESAEPRTPVASTTAPAPRKRTLSVAGRKAIADAARKRWAAIKAGKAPSPFAKLGKGKK